MALYYFVEWVWEGEIFEDEFETLEAAEKRYAELSDNREVRLGMVLKDKNR